MNIYPHFRLLHRTRLRRTWTLEISVDTERRVWNIPRGPILHAHDRHLAIELSSEDADADRSAIICWDAGPTEIRKWTPRHIVAVLHGAKLRGCFSLVRIRHNGQSHWLWVHVNPRTRHAHVSREPSLALAP